MCGGTSELRHLLVESWPSLVIVTLWSIAVVLMHDVAGFKWLVMPVLPVTLIGIAVSLYVGFKSASAYNRWWEARRALGAIVAFSREWALQIQGLVCSDRAQPPADVVNDLLNRHLGWLYAASYMLRQGSRLKSSARTRIFKHRRVGHDAATMSEDPQSYGRFLAPEEFSAARSVRNPPTYLLTRQAQAVRDLTRSGCLDSIRQTAMIGLLGKLGDAYGACDRIKITPFPRQIAYFGTIFTWVFVFLLPLAFLDAFEAKAVSEVGRHHLSSILLDSYLFTLVPFAALISWVFLMMERVSDSTEDPFEGGVHDVPVVAICRAIEIDLKQTMGMTDVPPPLQPVDDVLY